MTVVINFNDLAQLHRAAQVKGPNSLDWIRFAEAMADSFPKLYETARKMNALSVAHHVALSDLVAQIELHTDCMSGQIESSALDDQVEAAERLVNSWAVAHRPALGAIADIAEERQRQMVAEGWTQAHDDAHAAGELSAAGMCYAGHACLTLQGKGGATVPTPWPWADEDWKPKNPRRDLVRAAALLVAEIERLDRSEIEKVGSGGTARVA